MVMIVENVSSCFLFSFFYFLFSLNLNLNLNLKISLSSITSLIFAISIFTFIIFLFSHLLTSFFASPLGHTALNYSISLKHLIPYGHANKYNILSPFYISNIILGIAVDIG